MKVSVIINDHLSKQQLEHAYLLCLAWLNFEHQVNVVFIGQAFERIHSELKNQKQWLALKSYGIDAFYHLRIAENHPSSATEQHCQIIDQSKFESLKTKMDLLL